MVSIIIPVYNGQQYIDNVLDSCMSQTYKNIEILLIDDGSTDGLELPKIYKRNKNIRFFSKKNEGLGFTRNHGIHLAKGEYIFFLDVDDTIPNDAIESLRKDIKTNDFIIGECQRIYFDHEHTIVRKQTWKKKLYENYKNKSDLIIDTISTNKLYKRDFLIKNDIFFEKGLYEDKLFVLKLFVASDNFHHLNKVIYYWHIAHNSNSITNSLTISNLEERFKVLEDCISYASDIQFKKVIIHNIIKHDFKVYINKSLTYTQQELSKLFSCYKNFYKKYEKDIDKNKYFVDRIILENISDKDFLLKEFITIANENNTKNIFIKIKKYIRYSIFYLKVKFS